MSDGGRGPLVAFLAMGACCAAPLLLASGAGAGIAAGLAGVPWVWLLAGAGAVGAVAWAVQSKNRRQEQEKAEFRPETDVGMRNCLEAVLARKDQAKG